MLLGINPTFSGEAFRGPDIGGSQTARFSLGAVRPGATLSVGHTSRP